MKSPRTLVLATTAALLLALSACSSAPASVTTSAPEESTALLTDAACEADEGITLVVDASALGDQDDVSATWCILADAEVAASEMLETAGVETEGTEEYGDQVVCRVDGVPADDVALTAEDGSDYFETCAAMPAAFAYWSLWIRPEGGEWAYAEEGLSTLQLQPGESLELLFTLNGEPAAPAA